MNPHFMNPKATDIYYFICVRNANKRNVKRPPFELSNESEANLNISWAVLMLRHRLEKSSCNGNFSYLIWIFRLITNRNRFNDSAMQYIKLQMSTLPRIYCFYFGQVPKILIKINKKQKKSALQCAIAYAVVAHISLHRIRKVDHEVDFSFWSESEIRSKCEASHEFWRHEQNKKKKKRRILFELCGMNAENYTNNRRYRVYLQRLNDCMSTCIYMLSTWK